MSEPIDLSAEREVRRESEDYAGTLCSCGEAWFNIRGVIDQSGHVTGYEWPPTCVACGAELERTR